MNEARETDVLVVGAGPTGLTLALWLARSGVRVRIVDKTAEAGTTSRALAVHARTLEFYRQLGFADAIVERGLKVTAVNLTVAGRRAATLSFAGAGTTLTPYPFVLMYPQDEHERFLIDRLHDAGVSVERTTELVGFDDDGSCVRAHLVRPDGSRQTCETAWLAGCDGARSQVRETLGTGFPGGTYSRLFYVADVQAHGPMMDRELHVALDEADFLAVFPLQGEGRARLIGTVKDPSPDASARYSWDDVSKSVLERLRIAVDRVNWFSTYNVHHRVTSQFRKGRVFLLGDAAHIHSPVGGQGMNTGIGDAVNLAWKLAGVIKHNDAKQILDTYEPERIAFAERLVETTDQAFTLVTSEGTLARFIRVNVVPHVVPLVFAAAPMRQLLFRTVSQIAIDYRDGGLGEGRAGEVAGGDRLPWVALGAGDDNFAPLATTDWQVHVYGTPSALLVAACAKRGLPLHAFAWQPVMEQAGLARDAVYLVRPDGYVALAEPHADAATLLAYLGRWGVRAAHFGQA